jgi:hypothetical protein
MKELLLDFIIPPLRLLSNFTFAVENKIIESASANGLETLI